MVNQEKIKAVAVDYINTLPLRLGVEEIAKKGLIDISLEKPAKAAEGFFSGQYQLGLLPVAAKLQQDNSQFVGDFGIVSDGFVGSVGIFSQVPFSQIELVNLDFDSKSSVLLFKVLHQHHFKNKPRFQKGKLGYRNKIKGTTAGLIIGDPAIEARKTFPYYIDLAQEWYKMTGLPFVFAAWISNVVVNEGLVQKFDQAQLNQVSNAVEIAHSYQHLAPQYDLVNYFTNQLQYRINQRARKGLELFLSLGQEILNKEKSLVV